MIFILQAATVKHDRYVPEKSRVLRNRVLRIRNKEPKQK